MRVLKTAAGSWYRSTKSKRAVGIVVRLSEITGGS
jgi:hypothetical protein